MKLTIGETTTALRKLYKTSWFISEAISLSLASAKVEPGAFCVTPQYLEEALKAAQKAVSFQMEILSEFQSLLNIDNLDFKNDKPDMNVMSL